MTQPFQVHVNAVETEDDAIVDRPLEVAKYPLGGDQGAEMSRLYRYGLANGPADIRDGAAQKCFQM